MKRTVEGIKKTIEDLNTGTADSMLKFEFVEYIPEENSLILDFPFQEWEVNSKGSMHGMVICGILDMVMGVLSNRIEDGTFAPTSNIAVEFIRPIAFGDSVRAQAWLISEGKRMVRMRGEARRKSDNKIFASGSATFVPLDLSKKE